LTVRLACVKHAASVRSEPGSNSQVHPTTPHKRRSKTNRPKTHTPPNTRHHTQHQAEIRNILSTHRKIHKTAHTKRRPRIPSIPDAIVNEQTGHPPASRAGRTTWLNLNRTTRCGPKNLADPTPPDKRNQRRHERRFRPPG